ncbi:hypothetical protein L1887_19890 [Cichorium endivia]|nr:hypothetical protein L1887_19890 [Cichorium endivia]
MAMQIVLPTPPPPPPLLPVLTEPRSSLYAGDLHPDTTDKDLYLLFSMIGPVQSVRICRDRFSSKSLCYAYINFYLHSHAAVALSRLNHTELRGNPMRLMWCQRNPLTRKTGVANLFVKNLDSSVTEAKLEKIFGKFGRIHSCKIAKNDLGKSKGFGFVQYDSEESANDALTALDGTTFEGKIISVAKFLKKSERKEPEFTNVYVKNLDSDFTENLLIEKFSEYGNVTSAVIMSDADGKSRGFGFVNFESHESAKNAIEALNGALIGSKELFVGKAMKKSEREGFLKLAHKKDTTNPSNLFLKNLAASVDEQTLEETFGAHGHVLLTKVIRHQNGISKGFGFVCFSNQEEAKKARDSLNGKFYHGKYLNVYIALSKEESARKLQAKFASQTNLGHNQYNPNYYSMQSFVGTPVYDPYWRSNVQLVPNFKPNSYHLSYEKNQSPFMSNGFCIRKGSLANKANHDQNVNGVKKSKMLWEMKTGELQGSGKAFGKLQVNGHGLEGKLSY